MYTLVLDKTLNLILLSYVGSGDCNNDFSSTSSSGCGSSNVQSLLQEVALQGPKTKVFYFFLFDLLSTYLSDQFNDLVGN